MKKKTSYGLKLFKLFLQSNSKERYLRYSSRQAAFHRRFVFPIRFCSFYPYDDINNMTQAKRFVGGAVASWLVRSSPDRAVRVRALAGDLVLCSWARNFTLTVPLSTQVYKWVPANLMLGGNPAMD